MSGDLLKLRPATFGFALFCFFLPFVTVSCPGGQYTFSGVELVTGVTVEGQTVPGESAAILAAVCGVVALVLCFTGPGPGALAAAVFGGIGGVYLFALKVKLENDALREGGGVMQLSFEAGFWLAVVAFGSGVLVNLIAAFWAGPMPAETSTPASPSGEPMKGA